VKKQAFTLVEVLVASVIIAIGFAGVYAIVGMSNKVFNDAIERQRFNFKASKAMESVIEKQNIRAKNIRAIGHSLCKSVKNKDIFMVAGCSSDVKGYYIKGIFNAK